MSRPSGRPRNSRTYYVGVIEMLQAESHLLVGAIKMDVT